MSRAAEAAEKIASSQMNCAQAVLTAFNEELGLGKACSYFSTRRNTQKLGAFPGQDKREVCDSAQCFSKNYDRLFRLFRRAGWR